MEFVLQSSDFAVSVYTILIMCCLLSLQKNQALVQIMFYSLNWTRRPLTFLGHLLQGKRVTVKLPCMMSSKRCCQERNAQTNPPATELSIQQQQLLSCMICLFVPSTMCLLELTLKQVLDPTVNLWYWKHQVSTIDKFNLASIQIL